MPAPVTPIIAGFERQEVTFAKDQSPYIPLPALVAKDGRMVTRWMFTEEERKAIAAGADLFLVSWTFNKPPQPVCLIVNMDADTPVRMAFALEL